MTDLNPRFEEIAKAAAEISTLSSEEAFELFAEGMRNIPKTLQAMVDSVVAIQFDWPMPEEGWKRFVESVEHTNERFGLNLHVNPPEHFDPLNIADALEKYATSIDKTRDELDDTEKMQAMVNAVLAQGERSMTEPTFIMAYPVDTIRLIRATLRGTTEPLVPYKADPLEFCQEAHKVKDELVGHAMELLENTIDVRFNNWISVEERMPEVEQKVLVWAKASIPIGGMTGFPFVLVYEGGELTENFVLAGEIVIVTHWMPLPESPSTPKDIGE